MKILIVNDDSIHSPGIRILAQHAAKFGEVWVIAPENQCSAMSMRLTLVKEMEFKPYDFPVPVEKAFSLNGTPADCVKTALAGLLPFTPDWVFSGINEGYNAGRDILYSGTCGAASEAALSGVRSAAFSTFRKDTNEIVELEMDRVMEEMFASDYEPFTYWNINFPGCSEAEYKGIKRNTTQANLQLYTDQITVKHYEDGSVTVSQLGYPCRPEDAPEGSDIRSVLDGYTSFGLIRLPFAR